MIFFRIKGRVLTILTRDGEAIGRIGYGVSSKLCDYSPAVGYGIDNPAYLKQGIMGRALAVYLEHMEYNEIYAVIMPWNIASQKTVLKNGFKLLGTDDNGYLVFEYVKPVAMERVAC